MLLGDPIELRLQRRLDVVAGLLQLRGDGSEKGGIVKLSTQKSIRTTGSLIDPADAMEQIVNALREWAATGKIDCNFDG